tara:strand:+ start:1792 stop:2571 length:780 start_codon:yes stop_codon:yes gene_type:complete
MRHIHVIGCKRSGTTLMMELLWNSYRFAGRSNHEASIFNCKSSDSDETLYLSKKPADTTKIEKIFLADSDLFLVGVQRDPRSVIASTHPSKKDLYFADFYKWEQCKNALSRLHDHPRFLLVRYEDLLTNPDREQERISQKFVLLKDIRKFSEYPNGSNPSYQANRSLGGTRPFDQKRISGWMNHLPRIKGQLILHPHLPEVLINTGYENNDEWTKLVDHINPYYQSYKDGGPNFLRATETKLRFKWKTRKYMKQLNAKF